MARKILLADDSVTAQNMGRKILADAGYEVITVNNGSAALKKITETKPDLIVLDVYMPGYSGLEVCQRIKEVQETSRIPVLLTVGKLEPFKPEEARRVRAEGYIVKPFEASELLSALAKLEDKIVPRPEASKPGRFARAIAAVEEGHFDKTVAIEEDSSWKNRIAFPSKKKKKSDEDEEDGDDPAIYNAVNKDLRTVVPHEPAHKAHEAKAHEAKADEGRVDLGALAPEGLPNNVTPEEIAALAAAAAQVKGKFLEASAEPVPQSAHAPEAPPAARSEHAQEPAKSEEVKPAPEPVKEFVPETPAVATFAEQKADEKTDALVAAEAPAPNPADVVAAIASLEPASGTSWAAPDEAARDDSASGGNGSGSHRASEEREPEPVTMAVASGVSETSSRWTASAVALAADETGISLEQEMQKAYAAFAAAEIGPAGSVVTISDAQAAAPVADASPIEASVTAFPSSAPPTSEESKPFVAEPVRPAVKAFETVSASSIEKDPPVPAEPEQVQAVQPSPVSEAIAPQALEARPADEVPAAEIKPAELDDSAKTEESKTEELKAEVQKTDEAKTDEAKIDATKSDATKTDEAKTDEAKKDQEFVPAVAAAPEAAEQISRTSMEPEIVAQSSENQAAEAEVAAAPIATAAGGTDHMAKKESEIAATTAAAWASWRNIRESGDPKSKAPESKSSKKQEEVEESNSPRDTAAMAVAAGAEKSPEEVPAADDDSGAIASIVDSVLADMRPKIVEEIARKMKKKK